MSYRHARTLRSCFGSGALVVAALGCSSTPSRSANAGSDAGVGENANANGDSGAAASLASVLYPSMVADIRAVPPPCGDLDPATASQLVLTRIDQVLLPAAEALGMIDTSSTLARFFATPEPSTITFAADTKTSVNKLADDLSEQWLIASNVESADQVPGQVTFLIPSSESDGGSDGGTPSGFGTTNSEVRIRVSRIDCSTSDTIELSILLGPDQTRVLAFELEDSRIYGRFFLGDWINDGKQLTEASCTASGSGPMGATETSSCTTSVATIFDPAATGVLAAEVDMTSAGIAHGILALAEVASVGWSNADGGSHQLVHVSSSAEAMGATVNPTAGTITGDLGLGGATVTTTLAGFVSAFFNGRSLAASANPDDPVNLSASALAGSFSYAAGSDEVDFNGMNIGANPAVALHGTDALMTVAFGPAAGSGASVAVTPAANAGVSLAFTSSNPLLGIRYNLASVASEVVGLPDFAQADLLTIGFGGQNPSVATLLPVASSTNPPQLAIFGSGLRSLLQVQSGQLDLTSTFAPAEDIHVAASQCLTETGNQSDTNDGLQDLSGGACQP